jgi:hypothetical protein
LLALLDEAVRQADLGLQPGRGDGPGWSGLLTHLHRPQGVYVRLTTVASTFYIGLRVVWWDDRVRRRHWHIEAGDLPVNTLGLGQQLATAAMLRAVLDEKAEAIHWITPAQSLFRRSRGGDTIVVCRCGFAGTAESLGWMGDCCGPCFDREQEGLPPLGPPSLRTAVGCPNLILLADDGSLAAVETPWDENTHSRRLTVSMWSPPYTEGPRWRRDWPRDYLNSFAVGRKHLAMVGQGWATLVPFDNAVPGTEWRLDRDHFSPTISLVGKDNEWLVLHAAGRLRGWPVTAEGAFGRRAYDHPTPMGFIIGRRGGNEVLLAGNNDISVRDASTGAELERFDWDGPLRVRALLPTPDGCIAALTDGSRHALARWYYPERGELSGQQAKQPVLRATANQYRQIDLAPDLSVLAALGGGGTIDFLGPSRLDLLASFQTTLTVRSVCFTPDGQSLLMLTDHGLAVYPWRELAGLR